MVDENIYRIDGFVVRNGKRACRGSIMEKEDRKSMSCAREKRFSEECYVEMIVVALRREKQPVLPAGDYLRRIPEDYSSGSFMSEQKRIALQSSFHEALAGRRTV